VLVFSSLFIQFFCFGRGSQSAQGAMLIYPRGGRGILCDAWPLPVWSAECIPSRFAAGIWWGRQPSCFFTVRWCGEAFHGLGVQGVEIFNLLGALFQLECGSSISARSLTHRAYAICFCALVAILAPPYDLFLLTLSFLELKC
jgi:hypothetical protein